jgi:hypothetical protein
MLKKGTARMQMINLAYSNVTERSLLCVHILQLKIDFFHMHYMADEINGIERDTKERWMIFDSL